MPSKIYEIEGIGPITVVRSKRSRHLRLSVTAKNVARVSIPNYVPYATGLRFALTKTDWLKQHLQTSPSNIFRDGARIGKSFRLRFEHDTERSGVSIKGNEIVISGNSVNDSKKIEEYCEKALRKDAQKLLPIRLKDLALKHGYKYNQVKIRKLSSRWGSCSSDKRITLSTHLIQLPWALIDYVILHELNHTVNMNHGPKFWADMELLVPGAKAKRKDLKLYKATVVPAYLD